MKKFLYSLTSLCCLVGWGVSAQNLPTPSAAPATTATVTAPTVTSKKLELKDADALGTYVGQFEASVYDETKKPKRSNKITIAIESLDNGQAKGKSIVAGNFRPFEGPYTLDSVKNELTATVKEPGDDKYDGTFQLTVYLAPEGKRLSGFWIANDKNLAVTERAFNLEPRTFSYDPHKNLTNGNIVHVFETGNDEQAEAITPDAIKFNASVVELKKEDVENMKRRDLEVMRNAIYARHGYSFKNRQMRDYFDTHVDWYMPISIDVTAQLTDLEKKNIELIKRYEKHAETYYDSFGR